MWHNWQESCQDHLFLHLFSPFLNVNLMQLLDVDFQGELPKQQNRADRHTYITCVHRSVPSIGIVFCCYNCLDLPWEKFFQVRVTFFPSSWDQEYCVEKRLCKFETVGREFVTFSRRYSCLREVGKQVTNTWKKLWAWYKSRQL